MRKNRSYWLSWFSSLLILAFIVSGCSGMPTVQVEATETPPPAPTEEVVVAPTEASGHDMVMADENILYHDDFIVNAIFFVIVLNFLLIPLTFF